MKNNEQKSKKTVYIIITAIVLVAVIAVLAVLLSKCGKTKDGAGSTAVTGEPSDHSDTKTADTNKPGVDPADTKPSAPAHVHEFGQWTVLSEPACVTPGEHERTCRTCGFVQNEKTSPLGHDGHNNECVRCGKKAAPAEQLEISPYEYGEGLWITDVSKVTDPDFLAPDVYDGQPIVCIAASVFEKNETVESISLPDSVVHVGSFFCYMCPNLRMIRLGRYIDNQYTVIAGYCPQLDYLTVDPDNTKLRSDRNCIIETETKTLIYGCRGSVIPDDGSVTAIDGYAFQDCTGLTDIVIPSTVTAIESYTFVSCRELVSVEIADSVTTIEQDAFYDCPSLKTVRLPAHITTLENELFGFCKSLEEITIPDGVTEIRNDCFYGCTSLKTVRLPESLKSIGNYAFEKCSSLESITLPSGLTHLGEAFKFCTSLRSIVIPDGVEELFTGTFLECTSLTEITLPKNLIRVPRLLFKNCTSLTSVSIPDSAYKIEETAFAGCTSLKTVVLPSALKYVENDIFEDCTALETVYFKGSKEQWDALKWRESDDCLKNAKTVFDYKN